MCHGGAIGAHSPPAWLDDAAFYCDASNDGIVGNSWYKDHEMFSEVQSCVGRVQGTPQMWEDRALAPGEWVSASLEASAAPIEVRLLTSRDTFFENIGITSLKLEAFGVQAHCGMAYWLLHVSYGMLVMAYWLRHVSHGILVTAY